MKLSLVVCIIVVVLGSSEGCFSFGSSRRSRSQSSSSRPQSTSSRLQKAFKEYKGSCSCGHKYSNNCAHYVSEALISAGYSELNGGPYSGSCVNGQPVRIYNGRAVCCGAGRPIRAKEIQSWASSKFTYSNGPPRGSGTKYCLVYQSGGGYWGGHVVLAKVINGHKVDHRGTGWYSHWPNQYYYC